MALVNCKECGSQVSTDAKACPKCGAKPPKRTSKLTWLVGGLFALFVGSAVMNSTSEDGATSAGAAPIVGAALPPAKTPKERMLAESLKFELKEWQKGGFDAVMLITGSISNASDTAVKDVVITCTSSGNSGTVIDKNTKTLYEAIGPKKTFRFQQFNMGFLHSSATQTSCEIVDFTM